MWVTGGWHLEGPGVGGEGPGTGLSWVALSQSISPPKSLLLYSQNDITLALQSGMRAKYTYIYCAIC